jgi:hypothetical protein
MISTFIIFGKTVSFVVPMYHIRSMYIVTDRSMCHVFSTICYGFTMDPTPLYILNNEYEAYCN